MREDVAFVLSTLEPMERRVQLHGGRVEVKSAGSALGSEFMVSLPRSLIVTDSEPQLNSPLRPPSSRRQILIADDTVDAAESLCMLLRLSEHDVHVAHSGDDAFAAARELRPDVCIFDIGMPDMNGYELAERVRREAWGRTIKLIALTGWGQESHRQRAVVAGFDHHFTKPVDPDRLEALFDSQ